ncbi:MAG: 4-alpha-glucanotransferase [Acidimicrobiales bacterium]
MARVDHAAWGIDRGYSDFAGRWREPPATTLATIAAAMGADGDAEPPASPMLFLRPGGAPLLDRPATLHIEDGAEMAVDGRLPPDLPLGYHRLTDLADGRSTTVVVSPGLCPLPPAPAWGWASQLYAVRSEASWGIGDLADLRELARWSGEELGAGFLLVNPLHAASPVLPQPASPYFPSSRRFRNPLYLRVEDVPGAGGLGSELEDLASAGRSLCSDRRIDRDAVFALKMSALSKLWDRFGEGPDDDRFDAWCWAQGPPLDGWATFCTLVEQHGPRWRAWPTGYRHPDRPEVTLFRNTHARAVRFHTWLQWLLEEQLSAASTHLPLVHDLAVGVDPDGADAWLWQDAFADGVTIGAPADEFNTQGQDWGLPPFDPWRLRAAGYLPYVETVRAVLAHGGGLRVDHVLGLFRQFWVPAGASPRHGAYVRYPASDLLDLLALEAHRAGAYVVGEDLGTAAEGARDELARRQVMSYRLLWFEDTDPSEYPREALAAVTTHDLPTVAGMWTGSDLACERAIGRQPDEKASSAVRRRLAELTGLDDAAAVDDVVVAAYQALAQAPSLLLAAALEDALAVEERPNMPGTTDEWPNWSLALPSTLEEMKADPRPRRLAAALTRRPAV